jgi:hypothetical protein
MKAHVRDGAASKTLKTLDIPGQKPIVIKVSAHDGQFFTTVGYTGLKSQTLSDLEEQIDKCIRDLEAPAVDEWEPIIVIYLPDGYGGTLQFRKYFVIRNNKGKIVWYCDFARHLADHPGLPDLDHAHRAHRDDEIESQRTRTIPYSPIAWGHLNRAIVAMSLMWKTITGTVNEAAADGSLTQRTETILEDAARAAMQALKTPAPTEEESHAQ